MKSSHRQLMLSCAAASTVVALSACAPTPPRPYEYEVAPEPQVAMPAPAPSDYAVVETYSMPPAPLPPPVYRPPVPPPTPAVITRTTPLAEPGRVRVEAYNPLPNQGRVNVETLDNRSMGQVKIERYPIEQNTRVEGQSNTSTVASAVTTNALPVPTPVSVQSTPAPVTASVVKVVPSAPKRNYSYSPAIKSIVNIADTEAKQGNWGRVSDLLERALRIDADNPLLWLRMAQVKQKLGDKGQAISMAQRANQLADNDPYIQQRVQAFISNLR